MTNISKYYLVEIKSKNILELNVSLIDLIVSQKYQCSPSDLRHADVEPSKEKTDESFIISLRVQL